MNTETLGSLLLNSKINLQIKSSRLSQGEPIQNNTENKFFDINKMYKEFNQELNTFTIENDYIHPLLFNGDTFIILCAYKQLDPTISLKRYNDTKLFLTKLKNDLSVKLEVDNYFRLCRLNRKRSVNLQTMQSELKCNNTDSMLKDEHFVYLSKFFKVNICIIDMENLIKHYYVGSEEEGKDIGTLLFKVLSSGGYILYDGSLELTDILEKEVSESKHSHLKTSVKKRDQQKLNKFIN